MPDRHATFQKMVQRLERRSPLDQADREALLGVPHHVKKLPAGAHVVRDGESPDYCSLLLTGFAYRYKLTGDGGRQIISFHCAAEFLDTQNSFLGVADHSVQMLTEGEVALMPQGILQELALNRPGIARALWIDTLIDASIFREWVVNVGRRDSRARVSHLLCEFSLRLEAAGLASDHCYDLPMTQEQLADAVGLTSVHVNRVLKQLGEEGLIRRDRRSITILDWERMKEAGDFNQRYLHHDAMGTGKRWPERSVIPAKAVTSCRKAHGARRDGGPARLEPHLIHVVADGRRMTDIRVAVEYHPKSGKRSMSRQDRISHHVDRAFEELDRARSAASPEAAIAHLALSELHLGRMKALSEPAEKPALRLVD